MQKTGLHLKAGFKLFIFFLRLFLSIIVLRIRLLFTPSEHHQRLKFRARQKFCDWANKLFGVKLIVHGNISLQETFLYVSNHRSFYDPVAFLSRYIANPVSKAEVSKYPVIGWGTNLTEVLMLDRNAKEERNKIKNRISEALSSGTSILIYPEGTTVDTNFTGYFRKGAFESTVRARTRVLPVAMEYPNKDHYWINRPLYTQFIFQMILQKDRTIYVSVGKPIFDNDPMSLMKKTKESIDLQIRELRKIRDDK